jgi:hypothetical protein
MIDAGKIIGGMIGLTIIGVGGVWIYRSVKDEERRELLFQSMLAKRTNNDPETRAGGPRGIQSTESKQDTGAV